MLHLNKCESLLTRHIFLDLRYRCSIGIKTHCHKYFNFQMLNPSYQITVYWALVGKKIIFLREHLWENNLKNLFFICHGTSLLRFKVVWIKSDPDLMKLYFAIRFSNKKILVIQVQSHNIIIGIQTYRWIGPIQKKTATVYMRYKWYCHVPTCCMLCFTSFCQNIFFLSQKKNWMHDFII